MVASPSILAALSILFITQSLSAALPVTIEKLTARGGGYPASNPTGMTCYKTWETVTNDPVVQYWYVVVQDAGNAIKADRVWNHLNLNGRAPTDNKYHVEPSINDSALTFHTSEPYTAARVSHALRSGSSPPMNIACAFTGKEGLKGSEVGITASDATIEGILEGFGGEE